MKRSDLEKIETRMMRSVISAKEDNEDEDKCSWEYQQGVLLSYREAELFATLISQAKHYYGN